MCGICGFVSSSGIPDRSLVERMMGRIAYRGPDGSGWYRDDRAVLGHVRLAIIDTAGGVQPLSNEDGTIWISFNGEIFNYVELAEELRARGHRMRTASDTEVIVHAYEEWGDRCFERFNGQWALALWDSRRSRLVLSRDRMGVRPLFYARTRDRFLFASEAKALFADPELARALDPEGLDETFTFWSPVAPRSAFLGVSEVPPGHTAILEDGKLGVSAHYSISFPERGREPSQDIEENAARLREKLVEASRLRFLRSDVPVGAYLSGGIDSSVTASIVARYTSAPLRTFSLRFEDAEFDEGGYQAEMAKRLGTDHRSVVVSAAQIAEVFPEVVRHSERPLLRAAPAPLFLLSKLVRESGYKVVVTGEGADEVLGGYDIYREAKVRLFWSRDPGSELRSRAVELLYPWMARSPGAAPSFGRAFFGKNLDPKDPAFSHRPRWDSTQAIKGLLTAEARQAAAGADAAAALVARMPSEAASWDPLCRAQWLEMTTLLPGYILASQGDRMLMANSVEGRFPFLDPEVIAFANALPARHKLLALDEKHILKRAFADLLPESILRRPKQPYRAPDAASFFGIGGAAAPWIAELASEKALKDAGIFEPKAVASLFDKCARIGGEGMSNTDNMRVLAVLSTMLLHQQFIVGDGSSGGSEAPPEPMSMFDMSKSAKN
jgi:asparagine synthase (glutamine-hydrolysing)